MYGTVFEKYIKYNVKWEIERRIKDQMKEREREKRIKNGSSRIQLIIHIHSFAEG